MSTMSLKDDAKKKVPERYQRTPEFATFLAVLARHDFPHARALRMFLDSEIASCNATITRSKIIPSGQHHRRACANHLKFYKTVREKILPYL